MPDDLDALAAELRALAPHLDVGEPAAQRAAVRARLTAAPTRHRLRRWILVALAALAAAVLAVAPARAAVVDAVGGLLRIAGVEVSRTPDPGGLPARPSPLPSTGVVSLDAARRAALFPVAVPEVLGPPPRVELADPDPAGAPRVVSLLYRDATVRLDEFDGEIDPVFGKSAPDARWTEVGPAPAIWLPAPHPLTYLGRDGVPHTGTARTAGPALIWSAGGVTYRLEGIADLDRARAVALSLR